MKHLILILAVACVLPYAEAQYAVSLEPLAIAEAPALQSFAWARNGSYLLLVGGRTDGLHKRQPFAAFDPQFDNHYLWVVDLAERRTWKRAIEGLSPDLTDQLHSTNMAFAQVGDSLFLAGGYGYSTHEEKHMTYPFLTAMAVPKVIDAIIAGYSPASFMQQIRDERMAVAGGRMGWLGDRVFIAGGHRFDGPYNPMGADHGPGFTQTYTDELRSFRVVQGDDHMVIRDYQARHDALQLHRRDYNLVPQIFPDGEPGYTMFAGVFQHNEDIPFLNSVDIKANGYATNESFGQYLSHYHTATLPIYNAHSNEMTTVFFGGISHFYADAAGRLIRDMDVPFIRTISTVTRTADGQMSERILPGQMPALLGAGSELVLHSGVPASPHGVMLLDERSED
ncbi:MAG: T9SS C-terminal target domain-containing protein, partial [Saprospiraceae bacterium]|nr:T9SS C-terminal target domain-containing protein [Saprospiraceae bacterium]